MKRVGGWRLEVEVGGRCKSGGGGDDVGVGASRPLFGPCLALSSSNGSPAFVTIFFPVRNPPARKVASGLSLDTPP